jgi:hypothetical protein
LIVTLGNKLLERPPDVIKGRGGWELGRISDIQKLRERAGREAQLWGSVSFTEITSSSDEAHIDDKVRVPIYVLVFAVYLNQNQWVGKRT